jgi:hypothetical protein
LGFEEQWRDGDLPTEGPRRFGRRNSGETLEPGPEPVANASPPQERVRQAAHNLRAEYLEICGVIAEDTSTLLSLAPCSRACMPGGMSLRTPEGARLLAFH